MVVANHFAASNWTQERHWTLLSQKAWVVVLERSCSRSFDDQRTSKEQALEAEVRKCYCSSTLIGPTSCSMLQKALES